MLLLLVQLVDDLILVSNLIIQASDGVVTVGLLLFKLLDGNFNVINVFLDRNTLLFKQLLVCSGILALSLLLNK